ncbi:MAG: helix-turn-helix transcriptional regulator [Lachnospiraceae bacterium]|nr:helix-turn-helix transcriptional regulator [Lachnospiraceae bacterium]
MDSKYIGERIKTIRQNKKWTQEQLAEKLGLSAVYIGLIERGEKIPKLETFINIANCLGVSADTLLEDVLTQGYKNKLSRYSVEIEQLNSVDQKRLFHIIDAYLRKN